jgi:peptidoglycan L-alanyl-D-glutamate endopeptidase CwlK
MSRDLNLLRPDFKEKVEKMLSECQSCGITMTPYFTIRTPEEQARLWRQSRTSVEIQQQVKWLRDNGAPYLASIIEDVGPQFGPKVTNAIPGLSWHQWGEAVDCFWNVQNRAEWSSRKKVRLLDGREENGYRIYAEVTVKHGMNAGGLWASFKDWPHIQFTNKRISSLYSISEIDQRMQEKFADVTAGIRMA